MSIKKEIDNLSEKYRKYLVAGKFNNKIYYFIYGQLENQEDVLLLDSLNRIMFFDSINQILVPKSLNKAKIFDFKNFNIWLLSLKKLLNVESSSNYFYALYDFDLIYKIFIKGSLMNPNILNRSKLKEFIDFINLVDDFSLQVKDVYLTKLTKKKSIRRLWEFYYDVEIWQNPKEMVLDNLVNNFNEIEFKITLANIYSFFISNITFVN